MNELEKLKSIGLDEISKKTRIDIIFLQNIVDKNFEKLPQYNTKGFIKILQDEYGVGLKAWLSEYQQYCEENKTKKEENYFGKDLPKESEKSTFSYKLAAALVALVIGGYFTVDWFSKSYLDQNATLYPTPIVKKAQENAKIIEEQQLEDANTSVEEIYTIIDEDSTASTITDDIKDDNLSQNPEYVSEVKEDITEKKDILQQISEFGEIRPKVKIWVGVIDLETNKRKSYLTANNIQIDLDKKQLLKTGHGQFVYVDKYGQEQKFTSKNPINLLVENGKLSQISQEEFNKINGGKAW